MGILLGSKFCVVLIVVCILCVVLLIFWLKLNCKIICVLLSELLEVILLILVMCLSECFSGVVMEDVIVFGDVLGSEVLMIIIGKLICGSGVIGSIWKFSMLYRVMVIDSKIVVIGW